MYTFYLVLFSSSRYNFNAPTISYAGGSLYSGNKYNSVQTNTNINMHRKVDSNLLEARIRFVRYLIQCMTLVQ